MSTETEPNTMTTDDQTTGHDDPTTTAGCCHTPGGHGINRDTCHRCRVETDHSQPPTGRDADHAHEGEAVASAIAAHQMVPVTAGQRRGQGNPFVKGYRCLCGERAPRSDMRDTSGEPIDSDWFETTHLPEVAVSLTTRLRADLDVANALVEGGVGLIAAERRRQQEVEGYTTEHDVEHDNGALTDAAIEYMNWADWQRRYPDQPFEHAEWLGLTDDHGFRASRWPWAAEFFKPSDDPVRNLVKAGALIAAEIDRLHATGEQP